MFYFKATKQLYGLGQMTYLSNFLMCKIEMGIDEAHIYKIFYIYSSIHLISIY